MITPRIKAMILNAYIEEIRDVEYREKFVL